MKNLTQLLSKEPTGPSSILRAFCNINLSKIPDNLRYLHIFTLFQLITACENTGWVEHTSDWDLYILINGTISTLNGYTDIKYLNANKEELSDTHIKYAAYIQFGYDSADEPDYQEIIIPISEIITISLEA